MRAEFSAVRAEIAVLGVKLDEQRTHARVLHEEVISRIALLQEGRSAQLRRPRKK